MSCKSQPSGPTLLNTRIIGESLIGRKHELITNCKFPICDSVGLPHRVAGRIAIPLCILFRWVAEVINFVSRVIRVNIYSFVVDRTLDFVRSILDTPKPEEKKIST